MTNTLTPTQFVKKWSKIQLKEKAASQSQFNDICTLVGHKPPMAADPKGEFFTFEADAEKLEGKRGWADAWYKGHFIWEYKGPHRNLDAAYQQLLLYKDSLGNPPLLITSDMEKILIHTNFTNTVKKVYTITFDTILDGSGFELLRLAFYDPEKLRPSETQEQVTRATANDFVEVADKLKAYKSGQGIPPEQLAHFLIRLLFCLFAEDIKLLPNEVFSKLMWANLNAKQFEQSLRMLFAAMRTGGIFGTEPILHFNGGLFDNDFVPEDVRGDIIGPLRNASKHDWSGIDPSIFGTLFERVIDENKRKQLGAHYTSKEDILLVIEPVLMQPLRAKWQNVRLNAETAARAGKTDEAFALLKSFSDELASLRVLDPACGSGNFLYLALRQLLDLQKEVILLAVRLNLPDLELTVGPQQLFGIEINPYAHELAQITVWIGYLQWRVENGFAHMDEPILRPLKQIENKDAILDLTPSPSPKGEGREPEWPAADVVIGNPPFLGGKKMRAELGDVYVDALFKVLESRVPREADLVCYWFERARAQIEAGILKRAGLLATNSIRGGANRIILERIKETGDIFWAISDHEWILEGAAVNVSMIGFDNKGEKSRLLDGQPVPQINPDLSTSINLTQATRLPENFGLSFMGVTPAGSFDILGEQARRWLQLKNKSGKLNSEVLHPYYNGIDITRRPRDIWIIDFGIGTSLKESSLYEEPFKYVEEKVKPARLQQRSTIKEWWLHERPRPEMRDALRPLKRYIGTSMVAKHLTFSWLDKQILPANLVIVIAREDDYFFGVLQSHAHEVWALRQGTSLEDRPRYTPTTTFETFPFPWPSGKEPQPEQTSEVSETSEVSRGAASTRANAAATSEVSRGAALVQAIAAAAKQLDDFRTEWLNPSSSLYSGSIGEKALQKRTLTNLYNALNLYREQFKGKARDLEAWRNNPSGAIASLDDVEILDHLHVALDHAVLDAYGWPHNLSDEQILERLLALNLERANR